MYKFNASLGVGAVLATSFCSTGAARAQTWQALVNQAQSAQFPGNNAILEGCHLLTDGTVMCLETGSNQWHRLVPDAFGSYVNGAWDPPGFAIPPMPNGSDPSIGVYNSATTPPTLVTACNPCTYAPRFFASAVLASGDVVVIGGEFLANQQRLVNAAAGPTLSNQVQTNIGFMYEPSNPNFAKPGLGLWGAQLTEAYGSGAIGDGPSVVLQNGAFALGNIGSGDIELLAPVNTPTGPTGTFTALGLTGKTGFTDPRNGNVGTDTLDEEGLNILPNGTILTVDALATSTYEIVNPTPASVWSAPNLLGGVNMPVNIPDFGAGTAYSAEVGPGILRPDGTIVFFSANIAGQNAFLNTANPNAGWTTSAAMNFTGNFAAADAPAALLPNGDVIVLANAVTNVTCGPPGTPPPPPVCGVFSAPSVIFQLAFGGPNPNTLVQAPNQPTNGPVINAFEGRMLILPTGDVLFTTQDRTATYLSPKQAPCPGTGCVAAEIYTSGTLAPQAAWRPAITSGPPHVAINSTYSISGTLFNGFSEGAKYGDDVQMATNYPLVRITNSATNHVFYMRTHDHSQMGLEAVGSAQIVTTQFDSPTNLENGPSTLQVVANGIASVPFNVNVSPNQPPVAKCKPFSHDFTSASGGVCTGNATASDVDAGSFDPDGDSIHCEMVPMGSFGLGQHMVTLTCTDPSGATNQCMTTVTINDHTPPVLPSVADLSQFVCDPSTQNVVVPVPTATDTCGPNFAATGKVISANGTTLTTPIPVSSTGNVSLAPGVYVIQWTATDPSGNPATPKTQTITVGLGIEASQEITLGLNSTVQVPGGTFSAIGNTGTLNVTLNAGAKTGTILAKNDDVVVFGTARVQGDIKAAGNVSVLLGATVSGTVSAHTTVNLPPGKTLAGLTFPSPLGSSVTVPIGGSTTLSPGSHNTVIVSSGGTLTLTAGSHFIGNLQLFPSSTLKLDQSGGAVKLFVQSNLLYQGQVQNIGGTAGSFLLGYAGSLPLILQTPFPFGTLIAPNAEVDVNAAGANSFNGQLFAKEIETHGNTTLTCNSVNTTAGPAGQNFTVVPAGEGNADDGGGLFCSMTRRSRAPGAAVAALGVAVVVAFGRRRRRQRARSV